MVSKEEFEILRKTVNLQGATLFVLTINAFFTNIDGFIKIIEFIKKMIDGRIGKILLQQRLCALVQIA